MVWYWWYGFDDTIISYLDGDGDVWSCIVKLITYFNIDGVSKLKRRDRCGQKKALNTKKTELTYLYPVVSIV